MKSERNNLQKTYNNCGVKLGKFKMLLDSSKYTLFEFIVCLIL
jgi:hypothetical protein